MAQIKRVKYFTKDKKAKINPDNIKLYDKYLRSNILRNREVKATTYNVYNNYMTQFLVYLSEEWENVGLYEDILMEEAVDIMEGFIAFCQDTLFNNKKVINTKLSAISSFYLWSMKRGLIEKHPFDKKLDRMKGANEEKIINHYFLDNIQINKISKTLAKDNKNFDIIDRLIWEIALDSAGRVGAITSLTLSSLDLENNMFKDIREKRGYRVEIPFYDKTKKLIKQWLELRKDMDNLEVDAFFITRYGKEYRKMSKMTIQRRVKKIGTIIDIEDFHIHCIRKTSLNKIIDDTGDITLAAEMANHKSIETTRQSYQKPKSKSEVMEKIRQLKKASKTK